MPEWLIRKIQKEYERKGKSSQKAKEIAYATLNKKGLLKDRIKRKKD